MVSLGRPDDVGRGCLAASFQLYSYNGLRTECVRSTGHSSIGSEALCAMYVYRIWFIIMRLINELQVEIPPPHISYSRPLSGSSEMSSKKLKRPLMRLGLLARMT
jgi:hypothetical protein